MSELSDLGQHCRDMAEAADVTGIPKAEADLWRNLANEIEDYLTPADEPALFDQPTRKATP